MDLSGSTIMILGGSGLVGHAVARRLLDFKPKQIVLVALYQDETEATKRLLAPYAGGTALTVEYGDVYLPTSLARGERGAALEDPTSRRLLVDDIYGDLTEEVVTRSFLVQLLTTYKPAAVVDAINTATAFAYQDVYTSTRQLLQRSADGKVDQAAIERHALTMPIPQLTRHVQILLEGLKRGGTRAYLKVGTSGTGGMGFNIPYTHSEERPSRTLLTKSAVAGAHTLLLYLLGRTPGAPATREIKPTAAIGWREIAHGPVRRGGQPIELFDCPAAMPIREAFTGREGWKALGRPLESVYINMGENGLFAREEFATITALGQMEFITPEEIAEYVVFELLGYPTGKDVVAALDGATAGPTYRAGVLREAAMRRLDALELRHKVRSVAFEMLGPPRLTKLLYESYLWARLHPSVEALARADARTLASEAEDLLGRDSGLRAEIISVGIPIVTRDGTGLIRGPRVVVPPASGDPLGAAPRGWVDLRTTNCQLWIDRAKAIVAQAAEHERGVQGSGSDEQWFAILPQEPIVPWRMATWIFRVEDQGERNKR